MITEEDIKAECLKILSHDGKINFDDLNPIGKATWMAYQKGFMEGAEFMLKKDKIEVTVCSSCLSTGITDPDCICCYSKKYPTIMDEKEVCKCCGSVDDYS